MGNKIEKAYKMSRIFLAVMTFIFIVIFASPYESLSYLVPLSFILATIIFLISYPSSTISKEIIKIGNTVENKLKKILYYIIILLFILFIYYFVPIILDSIPHASDIGSAMSIGLFEALLNIIGIVCLIIPYIQTIIVLILKYFIKDSESIEEKNKKKISI